MVTQLWQLFTHIFEDFFLLFNTLKKNLYVTEIHNTYIAVV